MALPSLLVKAPEMAAWGQTWGTRRGSGGGIRKSGGGQEGVGRGLGRGREPIRRGSVQRDRRFELNRRSASKRNGRRRPLIVLLSRIEGLVCKLTPKSDELAPWRGRGGPRPCAPPPS
eukprot:3058998-Pyramimonas_sp.AAC.1